MKGAIPPLPLYTFTACTGTIFVWDDYVLTHTHKKNQSKNKDSSGSGQKENTGIQLMT
jgi:hypothetical protein